MRKTVIAAAHHTHYSLSMFFLISGDRVFVNVASTASIRLILVCYQVAPQAAAPRIPRAAQYFTAGHTVARRERAEGPLPTVARSTTMTASERERSVHLNAMGG